MFKKILLFPHKLGQLKSGVDKTPHIFKKFVKSNKFIDVKTGNCMFQNLNNLYEKNQKYKGPILNIGGDHSMSIASVASSLKKYPNVKVLWFDAHPDLNTYSSSFTKNYHGMPLGFLSGLDTHEQLKFINNKLPLKNLMYIGIRDIDEYERKVIQENNIKYITIQDLEWDFEECVNDICQFIKNDPIHISFDVDCMDISDVASTGTPVKHGIKLNQASILLDILRYKQIVNVDITELNLDIGNTQQKFTSLANTLHLFRNYLIV